MNLLAVIATPLIVFPAIVLIGNRLFGEDARRARRDRIRRARLGLAKELP